MRVFIRDLEFYAYHGVPEEERTVGHRYIASIEFDIDDRAGESDRVGDTVDYGEVGRKLVLFAKETQVQTLERLVTVLGRKLLQEFPRMRSLRLYIGKRLPPTDLIVDEVGVERVFPTRIS